ncbi:MAG: MarC family protein [Candidatus Methanomethylicaceae archaeon]|jgi:multiple antibiotic resistance protein
MAFESLTLYIQAFITLFVVFDPIGNIPLFHTFTVNFERKEKNRIINSSVLIALIILIFFAIAGAFILNLFKISVSDFMIAGGILLFILSVEGLLGREEARWINSEDVAVVPLATPLMAGPGSIYTVIYLMNPPYGPVVAFSAMIGNVLLQWVLLVYSDRILRLIGKTGSTIISRIMAFILSAIAIGMIIAGIKGVITL